MPDTRFIRGLKLLSGLLAVGFVLMLSCTPSVASADAERDLREDSSRIAEDFVRNSPTFLYDGIADSLVEADDPKPAGPSAWKFLFDFDSEHPGYGDRSDETLELEVTSHEAMIKVSDGEVKSAVLDDEWDMLDQAPAGEWEWWDAGKQALYGVGSVFVILSLLTIITRYTGVIISRVESRRKPEETGTQH